MFDTVTAAFIRAAPPLPGLDPSELVDELTSAYIDIASARLAVGGGDGGEAVNLDTLVARMSRLADTYEGQIVLGLNPDHSRSAAFVAGSARQVIAQVARLGAAEDVTTRLDEDAVGAEIASALLFLIAERSSDAFEAARDIRAAGEPNPIRRALILALGRFARGQFAEIAEVDINRERLGGADDYSRAADLLFRELLRGLILLAQIGLGLADMVAVGAAQALFGRVRELSLDATVSEGIAPKRLIGAISLFAGPHHLAALLMRAGDTLREGALVHIPTPGGSDETLWGQWLRREADRWPFLWQNHRDAIATGYLNQGSSLVMTTPTGSGKTTLAALKIAATLAAGRTVLYLAPTHALVGQVERDLNDRIVGLARAENIEDVRLDETVEVLPDLAVVTPERCFAMLTFKPELFGNVGLLVFDECHLLGVSTPATESKRPRVDRRGIDAMLCLLTFMRVNTASDYLLLSAMVSNAGEVADWLRTVLGRPVFPFDDKWKPTRQLRTCVTYAQSDLEALRRSLWPASAKIPLEAIPYGLFSLASGWNPAAPDKLAVRPFANAPVRLKKGRGFWLTSNRYEVAAVIAHRLAEAGLKVIIFCESIPMCVGVTKALNKGRQALEPKRDGDQDSWRDAAVSEIGSVTAMYDAGGARAAVHHGELLPNERRLVETLFRNRDTGVNVLAATSTLAQGLNLPCEVVILAGTDRLDDSDPEEKTRSPLMAYEVLNALGRAGRAGQAATGLSIVIPGVPVGCNLNTKAVTDDGDLAVIFSESDQCLPLADPLTALFDQIEIGGVSGEEAQYLLRRLATALGSEREGIETFENLTRRSFGFHQRVIADSSAAEVWLATRKATLTAVLLSDARPPVFPWQQELAAKTGANPAFISALATTYEFAPKAAVDARDWIVWLLKQLDPTTDDFDIFLRPDTLSRVFGRAYTNQPTLQAKRRIGLEGVSLALAPWLEGKPLTEIEKVIGAFIAANEGVVARATKADVKAKRARRFSMRLAPDLGFLCGVLNQVVQKTSADIGEPSPPMVGFLGQLIRRGYQTPYHFVISRDLPNASRPDVQHAYEAVAGDLDRQPADDLDTIRQKLNTAQASLVFTDFNVEEL
jgi:hypothetical protein